MRRRCFWRPSTPTCPTCGSSPSTAPIRTSPPRSTHAAHGRFGVGVFNVGESAGTNEEAFEATKLAYELGSTEINAVDDGGWTALHGAAKRGSNEITQFLGDHGTTFDTVTKKEGWTALRIADGVFVGGTIKRADETAALIRKLMTERGLTPPAKVVNDVAEVARPPTPERLSRRRPGISDHTGILYRVLFVRANSGRFASSQLSPAI